ncbi:MAG: hypothetical protein ACC662_03620 [Planctomycetota bacterium]
MRQAILPALLLLLPGPFLAARAGEPTFSGPDLRVVTIADGLRGLVPKQDLSQLEKSDIDAIARKSLTVNLDPAERVNTIITRPGFEGRTTDGIRHGDGRVKVMEVMGVPVHPYADAHSWRYAGVTFLFDGFDEVKRIVIYRRR